MKILTVAFMLLFNYLDTLPKLIHLVWPRLFSFLPVSVKLDAVC